LVCYVVTPESSDTTTATELTATVTSATYSGDTLTVREDVTITATDSQTQTC